MSVRRFENEDFDECVRLLTETYNAPPWNDTWTTETASNYIQEFTRYGRFLGFVVMIDNSIVGAAFCREKHGWILANYMLMNFIFLLIIKVKDWVRRCLRISKHMLKKPVWQALHC